ncbi:hypothetical protein H8356DRAFT_1427137 [Neocallimastix lanati (nom. inval.)]|nr:hypothetical protein H8356DRAFT_1427137 [Neocallimastix sp. JGI-2020a]
MDVLSYSISTFEPRKLFVMNYYDKGLLALLALKNSKLNAFMNLYSKMNKLVYWLNNTIIISLEYLGFSPIIVANI